MEKVPMTAAGYTRLQDELKRLKTVERPEVIRAIEVARDHGDLSENAEYHAARDRQSFIEGRVADLEDKIRRAEVIDVAKLSGKVIKFGATVALADEDTDDDIDGYPLCNDCNDLDGQINPGVAERCDGIDNNCSGVRDDGVDTCPCPVRHFDSDGDDDLNSYLVCAIKDGSNNPLRLNWSQADEFCKRGTPDDPVSGYRLASINSQAENQAVYSWVGTIIAGQSIPFWLGGTDFESEGSWRWVNGDAWIYTNWATGGGFGDEPNNFNGVEHCLEMGNTGDDRWNDVDGGNTQFWVCEVQP